MATYYRPQLCRLGISLALYAGSQAALCIQRPHYQAVEIGALGGVLSYATSVNDLRAVVGNAQYADGHTQAFLWSPAMGIQRIQFGQRASSALSINNKGQICGAIRDSNDLVDAIMWDANLNPTVLAEAPFGAVAYSINNYGKAVGYREDGIFTPVDQAFLSPALDPNSEWTDLFDSDDESFATGINDQGEIVGSVNRQAFLRWPNGTVLHLAGDPNSGPSAMAVGINARGDVLISQGGEALLVSRMQTTYISAPGPLMPMALNGSDEVVGYSQSSYQQGFVWSPKQGYSNLDDLLDTPGWHILSGNSVNGDGYIAGYGIHNGRKRAVLLVPVKS